MGMCDILRGRHCLGFGTHIAPVCLVQPCLVLFYHLRLCFGAYAPWFPNIPCFGHYSQGFSFFCPHLDSFGLLQLCLYRSTRSASFSLVPSCLASFSFDLFSLIQPPSALSSLFWIIGPCSALFGLVWTFSALFGSFRPCATPSGFFWPLSTLVCPCLAPSSCIWPCSALPGLVQPCSTSSYLVKPCLSLFS